MICNVDFVLYLPFYNLCIIPPFIFIFLIFVCYQKLSPYQLYRQKACLVPSMFSVYGKSQISSPILISSPALNPACYSPIITYILILNFLSIVLLYVLCTAHNSDCPLESLQLKNSHFLCIFIVIAFTNIHYCFLFPWCMDYSTAVSYTHLIMCAKNTTTLKFF